ncbi:CD209 antigen-like protein E [Saccostrea echinata]|uniref:CD209 antigen-like protein E n=1 Tax=Saccostrea echinata TaxID=191078 RepID=UPI002A7FAAB8|nr:CD209 antigen-like protein E [Saccostrea echinata]
MTVKDEPSTTPCEKGWVTFHGSCYYFSKSKSTFKDAMTECYNLGAELVEFQNAKEEKWFDLHNRVRERERQFLYLSNAEGLYYTRCAAGQPDNAGNIEHCLTYAVSVRGMNDAPCGSRLNYACKK